MRISVSIDTRAFIVVSTPSMTTSKVSDVRKEYFQAPTEPRMRLALGPDCFLHDGGWS
jgi:hypothetical protein